MKKLLICMSGGRTSAYMTWMLMRRHAYKYEIVVCFANTGQENNETLDFVNECDKRFNFNTVWLEAVTHKERKACSHKIVSYETASRNGEPFIEVVKKYGVANKGYPHCTRELKENPILSYIHSIGWADGDYETAIGIRADEPRRINRNKTRQNKIYPLVDLFETDKLDVMDFWEAQDFDLKLNDYQGNCKWCFKKSLKKHIQIMRDDIKIFDFPDMLEKEYGNIGNNKINGVLAKEPRTIFRNYMTAEKMKTMFKDMHDFELKFDDEENEGCASSCEAFGT